jgi:hypothetical protein
MNLLSNHEGMVMVNSATELTINTKDTRLKLNKSLLIHEIIGNATGCKQIDDGVRTHGGQSKHEDMG